MAKKVFLNDKLIDIDSGAVGVTDAGFLYGAGLFETMRSYNGVVFCLNNHLERLALSSRVLAINNTREKDYIKDAVYKLLKANDLSDARLRITLTSGPIQQKDGNSQSTLLITSDEMEPYPSEFYRDGVLAVLSSFRQNPAEPTCGHKTTSYYPRILALNLAHRKRAAEALWFTPDGRLAEGCISNVFLIKDSELFTPKLSTPVLSGITRSEICRLAHAEKIRFEEKDLTIDDVLEADEIFLTNVLMQVLPVTQVEKHTVGEGKVGPVTKKLHRAFIKNVEKQCGKTNESKKNIASN